MSEYSVSNEFQSQPGMSNEFQSQLGMGTMQQRFSAMAKNQHLQAETQMNFVAQLEARLRAATSAAEQLCDQLNGVVSRAYGEPPPPGAAINHGPRPVENGAIARLTTMMDELELAIKRSHEWAGRISGIV